MPLLDLECAEEDKHRRGIQEHKIDTGDAKIPTSQASSRPPPTEQRCRALNRSLVVLTRSSHPISTPLAGKS